MTVSKQEYQQVSKAYQSLSSSDQIIFKSILDMTIVLLRNMQQTQILDDTQKPAWKGVREWKENFLFVCI